MINHPFKPAATCVLFVLLSFPLKTFAGNVTVTTSADTGLGSLRQTIANALPGDTVRFFGSLFGSTITLTSGPITLDKNLRIVGLGDDSTLISGNISARIFSINAGVVARLERMTLKEGVATDSGGAIFNKGSLTLQYCVLDNNTAKFGGALYNNGTLYAADCNFTNNTANAGQGGAVFSFSGTFSAEGCTFSGNSATAGGGAVASIGSCVINESSISANSGSKGGGIYAENSLIVNFTTIAANTATAGHGGGIYSIGNARFISCNVQDNVVSNGIFSGGGIYAETSFRLIGCSVSGNTSAGNSGGVHSLGELIIISTTLYANTAAKAAGAIGNYGTTLLINTSTISGNSAAFSGGGIRNEGQKATLYRCTIAFNASDSSGGGIASSDSLFFSNTIVGNNTADVQGDEIFKAAGTIISEGHNLVRDIAQSGFTPNAGDILGTTATPEDPLLDPLADNGGSSLTHIPRCGSPAIDNGDTTNAPTSDQREMPRVHGGGIDIGSVENQADPIVPDAIITNVSSLGASNGSLQALIEGGTPPYFLDWSTGDSVYTINGLAAGNYGLTVEDFYGCTATAVFEVEEPNGILDINNTDALSIFPNPAINTIFIQVNAGENYSAGIFSLNGKNIKTLSPSLTQTSSGMIEISVNDLPAGNYLLQLYNAQGSLKGKGRFTVAH